MEIETTYQCAYCFSVNEITIDPDGGKRQQYTEDCQTCCRPNSLTILLSDDLSDAEVSAVPES